VVCIESITDGSLAPTCTTDHYHELSAHRLHFDIRKAPNQFEWSFRNPELGHWVGLFLRRTHPDLVHVNSSYLLGGTVAEAAFGRNIPRYYHNCDLASNQFLPLKRRQRR
jgi:hypothetical protein